MMLEKNVCGNVYVNMKAIFAVMNTTQAVVKEGLKKNSGLYGIWTYDLCDTGPLWIYESHTFEPRIKTWTWKGSSQLCHYLSSSE